MKFNLFGPSKALKDEKKKIGDKFFDDGLEFVTITESEKNAAAKNALRLQPKPEDKET